MEQIKLQALTYTEALARSAAFQAGMKACFKTLLKSHQFKDDDQARRYFEQMQAVIREAEKEWE